MTTLLSDRMDVLRGQPARQPDGSTQWGFTLGEEDVPCRAQPVRQAVQMVGLSLEVRWVYRVYFQAGLSLSPCDRIRLGDVDYRIIELEHPREPGRPAVAVVEQLNE